MPHTTRIAVAFFGITRSLSYTIGSIRENVLGAARENGDVSVCCHFFRQMTIDNRRTGECGPLNPDEYALLSPDRVEFSEPMAMLQDVGFEQIKAYGDHWNDGFKTVSNLLHQLYSLKAVTRLALETEPDIVVYCRPDLKYHDSLRDGLHRAKEIRKPTVLLPRWQRHKGGFNDRFAICIGAAAAQSYGNRLDRALPFCQDLMQALHSERLIRYALECSGVCVERLDVRASRIRADGQQVVEDFSEKSWKQFRNAIRFRQTLARRSCHGPGPSAHSFL